MSAWDNKDGLVANIGFRREPQIKSRHKGMIWGVYVTPSHRGKDLAKLLLSATLNRLRTYADLEQVTLAVSAEQKSALTSTTQPALNSSAWSAPP